MKLSKRLKLLKYLVYLYIILLALTGFIQIVFGGILIWGHLGYNLIIENNYWGPAAIIVCIGPFILLLCWLGWTSITRRKPCQLGLFNALLVIVVCVQFTICAWALILRTTLPKAAENPVDNSFEYFLDENFKLEQTHRWNQLQTELKCCGVDGPSDYRRSVSAVPWSCCSGSENPEDSSCTSLYQRGCLHVLSVDTKRKLLQCALFAFTLGVVQSIGLFCGIQLTLLFRKIKAAENIDEITTVPFAVKRAQIQRQQQELLPLSNGSKQHKCDRSSIDINKIESASSMNSKNERKHYKTTKIIET